ncbi:hypothetical protein ACOSQ3_031717 [Xanthoceras sorbifolium]
MPTEQWRAPSPSWVKLNSDVALDFRGRRLGFGAVIRSSDGLVLASYSSSACGLFSPDVACGLFSPDVGEALAILRGIQLAVDIEYSTVCVESDAQLAVDMGYSTICV